MNDFTTESDSLNTNPDTGSDNAAPERPKKGNDFAKELLKFALIAILIVLPIRIWVAQPFIVAGASMSPTFETGNYLIVDQLSYHFSDPQRGDVVIFQFPRDPSKFFIKRIIGLPGEIVEISSSAVIIREKEGTIGTVLTEPYVDPANERDDFTTVVLEDDEYFVLGDNRRASSDSRVWGPVERDLLVGRAFVQLFPVSEIELLPGLYHYQTTEK